jgi:hypothetical protein
MNMVTLGSGDYRYEPVENWAKLPPGWSFREIGGTAWTAGTTFTSSTAASTR